MVSPQLPNAWSVAGGDADPLVIFGINIVGYQGSIFPAILVGWMVSNLEKWLRKFVPQIMDLIVTPFFTITITLAVMLFALGPILQVTESTLINSLVYLLEAPLGIGYIVFGVVQQVIVITGLHHSIGIVEIGLLNSTGENVIQTLTTVSMAGQFGAGIGAAFLFKDKIKKSNAISAALPTLFGITEPLIFGVNLRAMRVFGSGMAAGAIGGFVVYLLNLTSTGMGITFVPGLLLYTGNLVALVQYISVIMISFAIGFLLVRIQGNAIRESFN